MLSKKNILKIYNKFDLMSFFEEKQTLEIFNNDERESLPKYISNGGISNKILKLG